MDKFVTKPTASTSSTASSTSITTGGSSEDNSKSKPNEGSGNKRKKNSAVWNYFKRSSDRKFAKCLTCQKEYKTSGNTSNLSDHMKRFHPNLERYGYNDNESTESESSSSVSSAATASSASYSARSSMSVSHYFKRAVFYDSSSQRKKELDKALLEMIVLDMQPFSIVKDSGFRKFISLLDPRYELPSTYTLCHKMLEESYMEVHKKLKLELSRVEYVAITFDAWTSVATESYVTVTCHFVDMDFCLKSAVLSTKPLPDVNHTAHNLSEALKAIFSEWEITEKVTCIVSDNANNMIATCNILQKRHMPCFAHSLNLLVQDCINDVSGILKRVKTIVTYFKSSYVAMDTFKKEQNTKEPLKLLQEVPTRWNSSFHMIQRVLKTNEALNRSLLQLRNAPVPLSLEELTILEDIQKVLGCFEEATQKIQGKTHVTISLVIPLTFEIYNSLISSLPELQTEEGKTFCNNLLQSVRTRLYPYETRSVARLGTILDARFKKEGFCSAENAACAATLLEQEMFNIMRKLDEESKKQNDSLTFTENSSEKPKQNSTLFGFLSDRLKVKEKSITADVTIIKRQYLERPNSNTNVDPLLFWKVAGEDLKSMDHVARKFFCIPASSAESERVFSLTGQLIEQRRSRLKPKNVNMIVFLNKNFKIYNLFLHKIKLISVSPYISYYFMAWPLHPVRRIWP